MLQYDAQMGREFPASAGDNIEEAGMGKHVAGERAALTVRLLRFLRGWSQQRLAEEAGLDRKEIYAYEAGEYAPTRVTLERLAASTRVPLAALEVLLPPMLWLHRRARGWILTVMRESDDTRRLVRRVQDLVDAELTWRLQELPCSGEWKVEVQDDIGRSEALVIWLCEESERAAADDAARACRLAESAVRLARGVVESEVRRSRLEGYAGHFLASALRVGGDLHGAEAGFAQAGKLWRAGSVGGPGRLDDSRPPDLEASLRRDQRRFPEALALLDLALAACQTPEAEGRVLLKKASTLEQMGDPRGALELLRRAARRIDGEKEPRQMFGLQFNLTVNLCHLEKFEEAAELLPEVRRLGAQLGNRLDRLRVRWLESRVLDGQGKNEEAIATLQQVQGGFAQGGLFYDEAIATLELARLYLRQVRTAETRELATRAEPVFSALGVEPRVLEAVQLFLAAARQEAATLELLDQALQALSRAKPRR